MSQSVITLEAHRNPALINGKGGKAGASVQSALELRTTNGRSNLFPAAAAACSYCNWKAKHHPYQEPPLEMTERFTQQEWEQQLFACAADSAVMKHQREFYQPRRLLLAPAWRKSGGMHPRKGLHAGTARAGVTLVWSWGSALCSDLGSPESHLGARSAQWMRFRRYSISD